MTGHMVGQVHELDERANTLEIENLARFAVDEHNKKENAMFEYKRLVDAKQQVVAGIMYYLTVEVEHGGSKKHYEAKVWEKSWENFKELQHFNHVGDAPTDA